MLLLPGPFEGRLDGPDQVSPVVQADGPVGFGRAVLVGAFDPAAAAGFDPLGNVAGPEVSHQHVGFGIIQEGDKRSLNRIRNFREDAGGLGADARNGGQANDDDE
jgi:hypothetical protein